MFDPLNILLLAVALVVFWRLRSVSGSRTGHERPPLDPFGSLGRKAETDREPDGDGTGRLPRPGSPEISARGKNGAEELPVWTGYAEKDSEAAKGLEALKAAEPGFAPQEFLEGAKLAYEMIVDAFAKGDKAALKPLLSRDVYESFSKAIEARVASGQRMEFRFVGIDRAKITNAVVGGRKAAVTVEFLSEMISATFDRKNVLVDGEPTQIKHITDVWTFERDIGSRDPNWKVSATGSTT
jgi:predicted lipid-binding transport protein (Tim44 family)